MFASYLLFLSGNLNATFCNVTFLMEVETVCKRKELGDKAMICCKYTNVTIRFYLMWSLKIETIFC